MMRLRVIWTGKTREAHLRALIDQYLQRLSHFAKCEVAEFRETAAPGKVGIDKDSQRISDGLREGAINVLLDPQGDEWTSAQLAKQIEQWQNSGARELTFIVGGPNGVSEKLAARANKRWSLSRLTLTHEMARVVLLEQLYRAYTIIHGLPYQK
ncbi:MAG: rRNA (pseudouridine1915-N3)-methyltransferase [Pyrinomonadaceae bacterium]|jgi:23S rRNA (pseudouridine1915-N3)-methyltransferase|nr:rRNA (pseudouridine1915-N3)-methyltransferase [Pyrinomonadaceae bacterium]